MKRVRSRDYVFRYKLKLNGKDSPRDPSEFIKVQLQNLLNVVVPVEGEREVKVDGFRFINDTFVHKLFDRAEPVITHQNRPESNILYEPRIEIIKRQLEAILSITDLEKDERVIKVDGFRLKNLKDWYVNSSPDPNDIIDYLGTRCNCDCVMCCNKGNPPSVALTITKRTPKKEYQEIRTRIKYSSTETGTSLFPSPPGVVYDVLAHPYSLETLRLLRRKFALPFRIHTNGKVLTSDFIARLAKLKPVYLYLSLNSASAERRKKIMKDSEPGVAITSLPLLRKAEIPYAVTIVPWPMGTTDQVLDDLAATISYADSNMAHLVEVNLPGYSRYFHQEPLSNMFALWTKTIAKVRELRERVNCPIVAMPCMFEENMYEKRLGLSRVIGLVRNSPAAIAGLLKGDIILEINGITIRDRPEVRAVLSIVAKSDVSRVDTKVRRGQDILDVPIFLQEYSYPSSRYFDTELGIILLGTGLTNYTEKLMEIVRKHKAQQVLFLSSYLVKPAFEQQLAQSVRPGEVKIDIEVPKNKFFGGNICMGDLLVVQDFIDCIKEYMNRVDHEPDLIVIPSSPFALGGWGRDLTGRTYLDIEREVGIPVELLVCRPIYE